MARHTKCNTTDPDMFKRLNEIEKMEKPTKGISFPLSMVLTNLLSLKTLLHYKARALLIQ